MTEKINIAIIAGQLVVGGAERQLYLWLSNMDRSRFDPIVLSLHPGHDDYWEKPIAALGIPLFFIQQRKWRFLRLIDIIKILRPYKPKLIHGWHLFTSPYAGLSAKILNAKSIGGVRSSLNYQKHIPFELILTLALSDCILTNSTVAASKLSKIKFPHKKVITVHNALEPRQLDRVTTRKFLAEKFNLDPDQLWVCSLGRMIPTKRFDILLQLVSKIIHETGPFHCILIGDGPEKANLEKLTIELEISNFITFTGEIPNAESWLPGMDIFCFPSVDEGLPNVMMEAAMAALPIIAWNYPFNQELAENDSMAMLIEPGDVKSFTEKLRILLGSKEIRTQLGTKARSHVLNDFSIVKYVQKMTNVYLSILQKS